MDNELEFDEIYRGYCCIDLLRAKETGYINEVVSGIFFRNKIKEGGCLDGIPRMNFCPFCGAKIITTYNELGVTWNWKTEKRETK